MAGILSNHMQSAYTHPQDPGQYQLDINSGISLGTSPPRAPYRDPRISQSETPYRPQLELYPGTYTTPTLVQTWPGYANEAYGAYGGGSQSIPGYDFNYPTNATAGPLGPSESASQYEPDGGYTMPNPQYASHGGGPGGRVEANYAAYHPATDQFPQNTMNSSTLPMAFGVYIAPNTQGAFPIWKMRDCWVSHAGQDEFYVITAFKRYPSA